MKPWRDLGVDFDVPDQLDAWRELWAFATTAERRYWLAIGFAPGYVLVHVALSGPIKDADLLGLCEPEFEDQVRRAFSEAQILVLMRTIEVAAIEHARAAELAAHAAGRLELRRKTLCALENDLRKVAGG
jgi:hypothetical protein